MKSFDDFRQDTLTEGVLARLAKRAIKPAIRWISKGKNKRIPNERTASLKTLAKDDISQLGKFKNPKTGELEGTFLPNPTKPYQMKDFVQGKGGLTWSMSRGASTGPTPIQRQAVYRTYRSVRDALKKLSGN
tara:strand:+ start:1856 stop:2251 length:396 start_codon:yes stop_codon:yes gene_type:complete